MDLSADKNYKTNNPDTPLFVKKKEDEMKNLNCSITISVLLLFVSYSIVSGSPEGKGTAEENTDPVPSFRVDPFWPKPLPNNWLIGQVAGVAVDSRNHIWIVHRPKSLGEDEYAPTESPASGLPYIPAPPVIEFDVEGNVVQAWGGPGEDFDWPDNPHGIFIDPNNKKLYRFKT